MDLNRYKLDNTYVRAILLLWADGVPWPSGARDRVPGAPTQARFSQLGSRHSVADGHAVLPIAPVSGYLRAATLVKKYAFVQGSLSLQTRFAVRTSWLI